MTFLFRLHSLTYLVSLWAFAALVFTGQLHLAAVLLFLLFWGLAVMRDQELWRSSRNAQWVRLHHLVSLKIPAWAWTLITLTAFCAAMYGWFILEERMYAVTYFFFYLELNKLLTARGNRDILQVYALTFFHMLAASVSTDSFIFGPMLLGYLFLMLQTLSAFTIKRDVEGALAERSGSDSLTLSNFSRQEPYRIKDSDARELGRVAFEEVEISGVWLLIQRNFLLLSFVVAILGLGIFWIVPRTAKQNFFNPGLRNSALSSRISGYADEISFGGMGEIQNNPEIVMRAEPLDGFAAKRPAFLRIRGTALDRFTGREWSKSDVLISELQNISRAQDISFSQNSLDPRFESIFKAKITVEPTKTKYFFTLDQPFSIHTSTPVSIIKDPNALSLKFETDRFEIISYEANAVFLDREIYLAELKKNSIHNPHELKNESDPRLASLIERVSVEVLQQYNPGSITVEKAEEIARTLIARRFKGLPNSAINDDHFKQLPVSIPTEQLRTIAEDWTRGMTSAAEKALAIEQRLKSTFTYTLDISYSNREDHLMYFLTETKAGHCEYFATAMVLLLRSIDVPARIVNGYLTDEWNDSQQRFIVRQENAHSWVEVRIGPDERWITFDPTPENGIGSNRITLSWYHRFSSVFDGFRMWWHNNIVDYSVEDQRSGFQAFVGFLFQLSNNSQQSMNSFQGLFNKTSDAKSTAGRQLIILLVIAIMLISTVVGLLYFAQKRVGKSRQTRVLQDPSLRDDLLPFRELMILLQQHYPKSPGVPPLEYARNLEQKLPEQLRGFGALTEQYYQARFGERRLAKPEHEEIARLKKEFRQQN